MVTVWAEIDGALVTEDYAVVPKDGTYKVWWRPPFRDHTLIGVYEDVGTAQVAAEMYERGRSDHREEVRRVLGF